MKWLWLAFGLAWGLSLLLDGRRRRTLRDTPSSLELAVEVSAPALNPTKETAL